MIDDVGLAAPIRVREPSDYVLPVRSCAEVHRHTHVHRGEAAVEHHSVHRAHRVSVVIAPDNGAVVENPLYQVGSFEQSAGGLVGSQWQTGYQSQGSREEQVCRCSDRFAGRIAIITGQFRFRATLFGISRAGMRRNIRTKILQKRSPCG